MTRDNMSQALVACGLWLGAPIGFKIKPVKLRSQTRLDQGSGVIAILPR